MTPDQAIDYLKRNRQFLNLSGIAKEAGIAPSSLLNHLSERVDADGYKRTIPALKLVALADVVENLSNSQTAINTAEELAALEKQLATLYKSIADRYRKMCMTVGESELKAMQSGIDSDVVQTIAIRERMTTLQKQIA